jgi:dolichol-phosphate mannosyltransferase
LIADDNSPDSTGEIAEKIATEDSRVSVLHRRAKEGIGPAYIAAFTCALDRDAQTVVQMDCDLSHDPAALPTLLAALRDADIVIGSRYVSGGGATDWSLARRLLSRGGCWYARHLLRAPIRDFTGGFKAFRRSALQAISFDDVCASGYGFQIEATYRALERGLRVVEVPITFQDRHSGQSKMSMTIALEAAFLVLRLKASSFFLSGQDRSRASRETRAELGPLAERAQQTAARQPPASSLDTPRIERSTGRAVS